MAETGSSLNWRGCRAAYVHPQRPPIYGLYEVEQFALDRQEIPPLITDATRWRKVITEFPGVVTVKMMNDLTLGYPAQYDAARNGLTLLDPDERTKKYSCTTPAPMLAT